MNGNPESASSNKPLLPTVVAIIVLGLVTLAWQWHQAHSASTKPEPTPSKQNYP